MTATPPPSRRYAIVTPARNEEENLPRLIESLAHQTVPPISWVVVDDGSTDATPRILAEAEAKYPWIRSVRRKDRGARKPGAGVIEAFYDGYPLVKDLPWDYVVKFDADLTLDAQYFEHCFQEFEKDPTLGIAGGAVWTRVGDHEFDDGLKDPAFHVRGATKIYRRACWEAIGGIIQMTGWDTFDEVKANSVGWTTRTLRQWRVTQHRETGGADGNWKNWYKNGRANYVVGYHPFFMFAKCCRRLFHQPVLVAAAGLWSGYVMGYLASAPRVQDRPAIKFLRHQQMRALLGKPSFWRG